MILGGGGNGIPSAIKVWSATLGGGGNGIPSANSGTSAILGGGGNGIPSADCIFVDPGVVALTDRLAGITMEPIRTIKLDAKVIFAKRMDGTSW